MKVVVAPDKFKGSLTAPHAAEALARGVLRADPTAEIDQAPMADGGEGTVEALVVATGGRFLEQDVTGPLGERVRARFGLLGTGEVAAIEMATASGLQLVPFNNRDPMRASTKGTGELIHAAIEAGAKRLILGIGGSATNDGGAGLACALGYRLLDADGQDLPSGGGFLERLDRIDASGRDTRLDAIEVSIACDVVNPLCGPNGASVVFGPQKGATPDQIVTLDRGLAHLARIIERDLGVAVADLPGAGAAGGLGAGLVAFAGGTLTQGVDTVITAVGLAGRLRGADLCLVAEGMIDGSTAGGKTAVGVARLARSLGCPVLALVGAVGAGAEATLTQGVDAYFAISPGPVSLGESMAHAAEYLELAAEQATRAFLAGRRQASEISKSQGKF